MGACANLISTLYQSGGTGIQRFAHDLVRHRWRHVIGSEEIPMSDPVHQVLDETRDTCEYKRALAVTMAHQGIAYTTA
jgi:hypothetical protein